MTEERRWSFKTFFDERKDRCTEMFAIQLITKFSFQEEHMILHTIRERCREGCQAVPLEVPRTCSESVIQKSEQKICSSVFLSPFIAVQREHSIRQTVQKYQSESNEKNCFVNTLIAKQESSKLS